MAVAARWPRCTRGTGGRRRPRANGVGERPKTWCTVRAGGGAARASGDSRGCGRAAAVERAPGRRLPGQQHSRRPSGPAFGPGGVFVIHLRRERCSTARPRVTLAGAAARAAQAARCTYLMDVEARIGPAGCGMKAAAFATTAAAVMARLMVGFFGNSECRFFHLCGVTCRAWALKMTTSRTTSRT